MLGRTELSAPDGREHSAVLSQPKRLALLAYLALSSARGFTRRDTIVAMFWSELDEEHARGALSQALRFLRRELGEGVFLRRGDEEVAVDFEVLACDAVSFDRACDAGDIARANTLYRGELLESFFIGDARQFEHWVDMERDRLARRHGQALEALASQYLADGNRALAIECWRRRALAEPCNAGVAMKFMLALSDSGDRAGAIAHGSAHMARVAADLEAAPDPAVIALTEALRRAPPPPSGETRDVSINGDASQRPESTRGRFTDEKPTGPERRRRLLSVRKVNAGIALAFGGLVLGTGLVMQMGTLGVGPVSTLLSSKALAAGDTIVVAEFADHSGDSLAVVITDVVRADLSESRAIHLMQGGRIRETLRLMERDSNATLTASLALQVAVREGAKAVLNGDVKRLGLGYIVSVRLVGAETGDELLLRTASATDSTKLIGAIERVSRGLREGIGESLRSVRASPPLARATTSSLPALRHYTQAMRAFSLGLYSVAIPQFRAAIAEDSTFAEAYRALAAQFIIQNSFQQEQVEALASAFRYRDRLPTRMRHFVAGSYFAGIGDLTAARDEYQSAVDADSLFQPALNNLCGVYAELRDYSTYRSLVDRIRQLNPDSRGYHFRNVQSLIGLGRLDSAQSALAEFDAFAHAHPASVRARDEAATMGVWLAFQQRAYAAVRQRANTLRTPGGIEPVNSEAFTAYADAIEGHFRRAEVHWRTAVELARTTGNPGAALEHAANFAEFTALTRGSAAALSYLRDVRALIPLDSLSPLDRPYPALAIAYARAGDVGTARDLVEEMDREVPQQLIRHRERFAQIRARGVVALEEGKLVEAARLLHAADSGECVTCSLPDLARTYVRAGNVDSSLAVLSRYVARFDVNRGVLDATTLAWALKEIGQLSEQRGEREQALRSYRQLVGLYEHADRELFPVLTEVRGRISRLSAEKESTSRRAGPHGAPDRGPL